MRLLVASFPGHVRAQRGDEMLDALEMSTTSRRGMARELLSLIWGSAIAWHIHLASDRAAFRSAAIGALVWFGLLVGVGPGVRMLRFAEGAATYPTTPAAANTMALAAFILFVLTAAALQRSRVVAAGLGTGAIVLAGASNSLGQWGGMQSILYEVRWMGIAMAMALVLAGSHLKGSSKLKGAGLPLVAAAAAMAALWPVPSAWAGTGHNYARTLQYDLFGPVSDFVAGSPWEWFFGVMFVLIIAIPFVVRAAGAIVAPAAAHITLVAPRVGPIVVLYVLAALASHYVRANFMVRRKPVID